MALCAHYTRVIGEFGAQAGQIDTLVLGCTHYPFASEHLQALLGPGVQLIDNGEAIARQTRRLVQAQSQDLAGTATGRVSLFTTGKSQALQAAARRWLGLTDSVDLLYF